MIGEKKDGKTGETPLDHEFDGIKELDNQLPRWWLATFYITIVFAVFYFWYYQLGGGPTLSEEFDQNVATLEQRKAQTAGGSVFPDDSKLAAVEGNKTSIEGGAAVFKARCLSCHGDRGQGIIGPNLTDNFWIHGDGKIKSIAQAIHAGVADKGMPAWGPILNEKELYEVTAFVRSLRGTNPAGARPPQGNEVEE